MPVRSWSLSPRFVRWLLLAATALGLAAMHSLGHGGGPSFDHPGLGLASMPSVHAPMITAAAVDLDGCAGDGCEHGDGGRMPAGEHDCGSSVCQAVLEAGLALVVGLLLLARARPAPLHPVAEPGPPSRAHRESGPEVGLLLCSVSVLRI